jgi:hypothetical protein
MNNLASFLTLENPFVLQTLFAIASLALGLAGISLGQRLSGHGNLCVIIGLAVGIGAMALLATPLAAWAPGWGLSFIGCFLLSEKLSKLTGKG